MGGSTDWGEGGSCTSIEFGDDTFGRRADIIEISGRDEAGVDAAISMEQRTLQVPVEQQADREDRRSLSSYFWAFIDWFRSGGH